MVEGGFGGRAMIHCGSALAVLQTLPAESVHCCVTSPPYFGLRDYGIEGQIGLEKSPAEYTAKLVEIFGEVRRVLRNDGTLWLNLGDSYATRGGENQTPHMGDIFQRRERGKNVICKSKRLPRGAGRWGGGNSAAGGGIKPKDLIGIPWSVAFELRAAGWYLRSDIIWAKPNPMPESVTDRPTRSHEYLFLLSRSERYYYDHEAIKEPTTGNAHSRGNGVNPKAALNAVGSKQNASFSAAVTDLVDFRNKRDVWTVNTKPYPEAHFATFPEDLIAPCILAGCPGGGIVLDPFSGAGTTGLVAKKLGRDYIGIELKPEYVEISERRINGYAPLFLEVSA